MSRFALSVDAGIPGWVAAREVLTANRTYYVRTDGNDSNDGLSNTSTGAFATLAKAKTVIEQTIDDAGYLITIQFNDGVHAGAAITWNLPNGERVRVRGNVSNPAACILAFSAASSHFFYVGAHMYLDIDGFTINHTIGTSAARASNAAGWANTMGILCDEGGYAKCGASMKIDGFFWNLFARRGGVIRATAGGTYTRAGDCNALAYTGGYISAVGCTLTNADDPSSTLGSGAGVEGGSMDLTSAVLTGNSRAGLHLIQGYCRTNGTDFSSNAGPGIRQEGGLIDLAGACTAGGNGTYGYELRDGAIGNLLNISNLSAGGAGANGTALHRGYLENYFTTQPGLRVVSPDANESFAYTTKGSGTHYFSTNGGTVQFEVGHTANAANRLNATGAGAGSGPALSAVGSDTDIDLKLLPKNAGAVRFGAHATLGAETLTGYITIKDAAGTVRKLAVVS